MTCQGGVDLVMWKKPWLATIVLACGTFVYHECVLRDRSLVSLLSDVLMVFFITIGTLGFYFRSRNEPILDFRQFEVSADAASSLVAAFANTVGAAESVLRVAACGSDIKLFIKVILVLFLTAAMGRAASGGTVAYVALWIIFTLPFGLAKLAPDAAQRKFLNRQASAVGNPGKAGPRNRNRELKHFKKNIFGQGKSADAIDMRSQGMELRIRHLSEQLRTKDAEVSALRSQIGLLTSDFKYNLKLLKERDWELDQNEHQMKEMLRKIAEHEKEHKISVAELTRCKEASERDRACILELKETLAQYQDAVHTVRQRLEEARQMRDQELSHHHSERDLLQGKLQKQAEELRAEIEVARKEAAAACERKWSKLLHECNQSVASLVSEKGTLLLQKRQLEKEMEGMREQVRQLQQTVADLSAVAGESRKECVVLRDQLETLKVEIHRKVEELEHERHRAVELELERQCSSKRIAALEHERGCIEESVSQRLAAEHESAVQDLYSQLQYAEHTLAVVRNEAEARAMEQSANHLRELEKLHQDAEKEAGHNKNEVQRLHEDALNHATNYAKELEKLKQDAQNQATMFAREIAVLKERSNSAVCACQSRSQSHKGELGPQGLAEGSLVETGQRSSKNVLRHHVQHPPTGRTGEIARGADIYELSRAGSGSDELSGPEDDECYGQHEIGDLDISPAEASERFAHDTNHYRVRMVLEAENRFLREKLKELQHQNETVGKIIFDLRHELEAAGLLKPTQNVDSKYAGIGGQPVSPSAPTATPSNLSPRKTRPFLNQASGSVSPAASPRKESFKDEPPLSLADREELQLLRSYYAELSAESDQLEYVHGKPPASAASSIASKTKRASFTPETFRLNRISPLVDHQPFPKSRDLSDLTSRQQHRQGLSPGAGHQRQSTSRDSLQERSRLIERRFQDTRKKAEKNLNDRAGRTGTPLVRHNALKIMNSGSFRRPSSSSESEGDSCCGNLEDDSDSSADDAPLSPPKAFRRTPITEADGRGHIKS